MLFPLPQPTTTSPSPPERLPLHEMPAAELLEVTVETGAFWPLYVLAGALVILLVWFVIRRRRSARTPASPLALFEAKLETARKQLTLDPSAASIEIGQALVEHWSLLTGNPFTAFTLEEIDHALNVMEFANAGCRDALIQTWRRIERAKFAEEAVSELEAREWHDLVYAMVRDQEWKEQKKPPANATV